MNRHRTSCILDGRSIFIVCWLMVREHDRHSVHHGSNNSINNNNHNSSSSNSVAQQSTNSNSGHMMGQRHSTPTQQHQQHQQQQSTSSTSSSSSSSSSSSASSIPHQMHTALSADLIPMPRNRAVPSTGGAVAAATGGGIGSSCVPCPSSSGSHSTAMYHQVG